jgi:hypothetical protein
MFECGTCTYLLYSSSAIIAYWHYTSVFYHAQTSLWLFPFHLFLSLAFQPSFHHSLCLVWRDDKGYDQKKTTIHNYFPKNMLHLTATSIIVSCFYTCHYACYCHLLLNEKVIIFFHYHCKLGYNYQLCDSNNERCQNQAIMAINQMGHIWIF